MLFTLAELLVVIREGEGATSIPPQCCAVPYIVNGVVYHNCTINSAFNNDLGCYNDNGDWLTCLPPQGQFSFSNTRVFEMLGLYCRTAEVCFRETARARLTNDLSYVLFQRDLKNLLLLKPTSQNTVL